MFSSVNQSESISSAAANKYAGRTLPDDANPALSRFPLREQPALRSESRARRLGSLGRAAEGGDSHQSLRVWTWPTSFQEVRVFTLGSEDLPPGDHQRGGHQPPGLLPASRYRPVCFPPISVPQTSHRPAGPQAHSVRSASQPEASARWQTNSIITDRALLHRRVKKLQDLREEREGWSGTSPVRVGANRQVRRRGTRPRDQGWSQLLQIHDPHLSQLTRYRDHAGAMKWVTYVTHSPPPHRSSATSQLLSNPSRQVPSCAAYYQLSSRLIPQAEPQITWASSSAINTLDAFEWGDRLFVKVRSEKCTNWLQSSALPSVWGGGVVSLFTDAEDHKHPSARALSSLSGHVPNVTNHCSWFDLDFTR